MGDAKINDLADFLFMDFHPKNPNKNPKNKNTEYFSSKKTECSVIMPHHGVPTKKESSVFMNLPALQTLHKYYTSNPVRIA